MWTLHEDRPLSGGAVLTSSSSLGAAASSAKSGAGQVFTLDPDDEVEPATATAQDLREEGEAKTEEPYFGFRWFLLLFYPQN